jgi:hypothetical protein
VPASRKVKSDEINAGGGLEKKPSVARHSLIALLLERKDLFG